MAFAALVYALHDAGSSPRQSFGLLFRLGVFPLFLFSGAFFPIDNLGDVGELVAQLTPLWHGVNLSRMFCVTLGQRRLVAGRGQRRATCSC